MKKIYGSTWVREFGPVDDGTWLQGLQGLTPDQLGVGITRCAATGKEFPPPLPKFRDMCVWRAHEAGMPSAEAAYREACRNSHRHRNDHKWSHAAVWHAARAVGFDALFTSADAKAAFDREYVALTAQVAAGVVLDPAPEPVPLSAQQKGSAEACAAGIAAMRQALRGRRNV